VFVVFIISLYIGTIRGTSAYSSLSCNIWGDFLSVLCV